MVKNDEVSTTQTSADELNPNNEICLKHFMHPKINADDANNMIYGVIKEMLGMIFVEEDFEQMDITFRDVLKKKYDKQVEEVFIECDYLVLIAFIYALRKNDEFMESIQNEPQYEMQRFFNRQ